MKWNEVKPDIEIKFCKSLSMRDPNHKPGNSWVMYRSATSNVWLGVVLKRLHGITF